MRICFMEYRGQAGRQEVIKEISKCEKWYNYSSFGDCLRVDRIIFKTGEKTDELFEIMLTKGYLDLRNYEFFYI